MKNVYKLEFGIYSVESGKKRGQWFHNWSTKTVLANGDVRAAIKKLEAEEIGTFDSDMGKYRVTKIRVTSAEHVCRVDI